jgi:mannan endo-1,4-beta-mannosidase
VDTIPVNGTWFQLIDKNGSTVFNTGPNGIQKLDKVISLAEQNKLFVLLSLTNNWNPQPLLDNITVPTGTPIRRDVTPGTNSSRPRNFLSNDYGAFWISQLTVALLSSVGGMDVYVRQLGMNLTHDQFFTNQTLINAFKNYITQVVSRYVNNTSVFSWEIANDPRYCCTLTYLVISHYCNVPDATLHSQQPRHVRPRL